MRIKTIALIIASVLTGLLLLSSCEQKREYDGEKIESEVTFTVTSGQIGAQQAEVLVRHNGRPSRKWYGFVTTDLTGKVSDLVSAQLPKVSESDIHVGTSQTVVLTGLSELSEYRYIAFGLDSDGAASGIPGSFTFSTNPDFNVTFGAEVLEVEAHKVLLSLSNSGNETLTYVGLLTRDLTTSVAKLVEQDYAQRVSGGQILKPEELYSGKNVTLSLSDLESDSPYRYIVYGLYGGDAPMSYGTPADITFTTAIDYDNVTFTIQNEATTTSSATFKVSYEGANSPLSWYAFNTADTQSSVEDLIAAQMAAQMPDGALYSGKDVTVTIDDLQQFTDYRFIVIGLEGERTFGQGAALSYQTADEDYDSVTFKVELVGTPSKTSAQVKVTHDGGKDKFQWYGFLTTDVSSPVADILPSPDAIDEAEVCSGQEALIDLTDLQDGTAYRYIVTGFRKDSAGAPLLYGTPGVVAFSTESMYYETPDWKISYGGLSGDPEYPYIFTNTVAPGSTEGWYLMTAAEKSRVQEAGGVEALLRNEVPGLSELMKTFMESYGMEDASEFLRNGTYSENLDLDYDTYYIIAIGFDLNADPTGPYAYLEYENKPEPGSEAYEKWIGSWTITRGEETDVLTISQKEVNKSYNIFGIEGGLFDDVFPVEALYDATSGNMFLNAQILGTVEISTRGEVEVSLNGYAESTGYFYTWSGTPYKIADFVMDSSGQSAQAIPGAVNGGDVPLTAMRFYGKVLSAGGYIGWNTGYTLLPNTLNRTTGGASIKTASTPSPISLSKVTEVSSPKVAKDGNDEPWSRLFLHFPVQRNK